MDLEGIREALHQRPFRAFAICLADGRRIPVTRPDSIAVGKHRAFVIGPDDFYSLIEPQMIVSLDSNWASAMEQCDIIRPGSKEEIDRLRDSFVVAVDLGFAKSKKKSCGLAWKNGRSGQLQPEQPQTYCFAECIDEVCRLLESHRQAVLIVEAPLSGLFDKGGNPVGRGEFEQQNPNSASRAPRYWYSGPGAAMCLAAAFFLRELVHRSYESPVGTPPREVVLYEGFLSFKKPKATNHWLDARKLVKSFFGIPCPVVPIVALPDNSILPILDVIGHATPKSVAPAIIAPPNDEP